MLLVVEEGDEVTWTDVDVGVAHFVRNLGGYRLSLRNLLRIQKYAVQNLWPFTRLPHTMAAQRFIEALLDGGSITVFGDGGQVRDYSYVGDVADATVRSLSADLPPAAVLDIASGNPVDVGLSSSFLEEHAEGWAPASSTSYASTEQQRTALLWRWRPR